MAKKRISITSSPLMSAVGSKVINQVRPDNFDEQFYENVISELKPSNGNSRLSFDDIDEGSEAISNSNTRPSISETGFENETGFKAETPTEIETGFKAETPTENETGFKAEPPTENETGFKADPPTENETGFKAEPPTENETGFEAETPVKTETSTKLKGPNIVKIDLNSIEREIVPIDCLRLEAIVRKIFEDKKLRVDGWVKINRETLKQNKINGARLKETRLICKARGTIDFKIENQGEIGKEQIYYKPIK